MLLRSLFQNGANRSARSLAWRRSLRNATQFRLSRYSPVYASLNFTDAGSVGSGNTVFAGVPVGQAGPLGSDTFAPALALTNFGTAQAKATVTLAVTGANGPNGQALATLTLPGQSSVTVPLGGKGVSLNCAIFPETLASAEALPGICLGVNDVSSPASLAT